MDGRLSGPAEQPHSCVICQRRKVKCERRHPCSNCVKHGAVCEFRAPQPPRRRKRQSSDPDVLVKLKRCEDLLQRYGIELDGSAKQQILDKPNSGDTSFTRAKSEASETTRDGLAKSDGGSVNLPRIKGQSQSASYAAQSEETRHLEELLEGSDEETRKPGPGLIQTAYDKLHHADGSGLLFGSIGNINLKQLHPPAITIFRLWQTYFTAVYPLTMVFHAPTVQQQILDASSDLNNVPKNMEALLFAIYFGAVIALPPEDCEAMLGLPQPVLVNRYLLATQQALNAAKLLTSSDIMVLQALVILLVGTPEFLLSYFRIGLHRDGTSLGLSPFETEIRRRLWWQIVVVDIRLAELSGAGTSMLSVPFNTCLPLNVNDADLSPEMGELPPEHTRTTDMTFCLSRYEIAKFLKDSNTAFFFFEGAWAKANGTPATLEEKDRAIDEVEHRLEEKYLKHCSDAKVTLHFLTGIFLRNAIYRMRVVAHHPQHRPDKGASMPAEEKEYLCRLNLNMIENDNIAHGNKSAERFAWYLNMYFQLPAFIYLISELRHRTRGELADRGWSAINEGFQNRIQFMAKRKDSPIFKATSALALKAWQAREIDFAAHREPVPEPLSYIKTLRSIFGEPPPKRRKSAYGGSDQTEKPVEHATQNHPVAGPDSSQEAVETAKGTVPGPSENPSVNPTEWSPMDWSYWDDLIQNWDLQIPDGSEQFNFGESFNFNGQ
ncbi:MAG: hypothetical protein Q9182_004307 [Xanthomendoza sp. 2 TL-2023]